MIEECDLCFFIEWGRLSHINELELLYVTSLFCCSPTMSNPEVFEEEGQPALGSSNLGASPSHLLIGDLQQFEHHSMSSHVPQQPLLLLPALPH